MELIEQYKLWSTKVCLTSVIASFPDVGPPENPILNFVLRLELGYLIYLAPGEAFSRKLPLEDCAALIDLGKTAVAEGNGISGPDTAIGRDITALELEVIDTGTQEPPRRAVYSLNHCAPSSRGPASWRVLFEAVLRTNDSASLRTELAGVLPWFTGR